MAEELQKIGWDNSRALCEAGAVPREPVLNLGSSDTNGPELIVSDDTGTTFFRFPSLAKLDDTVTGRAGISLLGVDDSAFDNIVGANGQLILESIDSLLTVALASSTNITLADISDNSLLSADQIFTVKSGTEFYIQDSLAQTRINLNDTDISITCEGENGTISVSANGLSGNIEISTFDGQIHIESSSIIELTGNSQINIISPLFSIQAPTVTRASTALVAGLRIPSGTAPTSPAHGDTWTTESGSYQRINGVTKKLDVMSFSDVSSQSPTTADQTFTLKTATSLLVKPTIGADILSISNTNCLFNSLGTLGLNAVSNLNLSSGTDVLIASADIISLDGKIGLIASTPSVYFGAVSDSEGKWRFQPSGNNIVWQRYESSAWVTKLTISA